MDKGREGIAKVLDIGRISMNMRNEPLRLRLLERLGSGVSCMT